MLLRSPSAKECFSRSTYDKAGVREGGYGSLKKAGVGEREGMVKGGERLLGDLVYDGFADLGSEAAVGIQSGVVIIRVIGAFEGQVVFIDPFFESSAVDIERSCHFREIPCGGTEFGFLLLAGCSKNLNRPIRLVGIIDHCVARLGKAACYVSEELGVGVRGGEGIAHEIYSALGRCDLRFERRKTHHKDREGCEDDSFHRLEIHSYAETVRTGGEIESQRIGIRSTSLIINFVSFIFLNIANS